MTWINSHGYDWYLLPAEGAGSYIGLTLAYGLADEPLEAYGTLQQLAGMLKTELSRPVELGVGQTGVPDVAVYVTSDVTALNIRGSADTLAATWGRLVEIFAEHQPLDENQPVSASITAAPRDISTRFGITAMTLASLGDIQVQAHRNPGALLRHLNPTAGNVRAVMSTNITELVGTAFRPPQFSPPTATPSRMLSSARAGALTFPPGYAVISTVVPRTTAGDIAVRVLAQLTAQHLSEVSNQHMGVEVALTQVGPDMLATVMSQSMVHDSALRSEVHQRLAAQPVPDHRITQAIGTYGEHEELQNILGRKVHGVDDDAPTESAVHHALAQARENMRFFTDQHSTIPAGYAQLQPELPQPQGQRFRSKATHETLTLGTHVVQRELGRGANSQRESVDMQQLALVIEDTRGATVLIDQEFRTLDVVPARYRKAEELQTEIDRRTTGVPRILADNAAQLGATTHAGVKTGATWKWAVLFVLAIILVNVVRAALNTEPVDQTANPPATEEHAQPEPEIEPQDHQVETEVGETATRPNWARVTVKSVERTEEHLDERFPANAGHFYLVDVEYCAAEPDSVDPEHFRLLFGENTMIAHPVAGVENQLEARELEQGQCATGNLGFYTPQDDVTNLRIDHRQGDLSSITWNVPNTESLGH